MLNCLKILLVVAVLPLLAVSAMAECTTKDKLVVEDWPALDTNLVGQYGEEVHGFISEACLEIERLTLSAVSEKEANYFSGNFDISHSMEVLPRAFERYRELIARNDDDEAKAIYPLLVYNMSNNARVIVGKLPEGETAISPEHYRGRTIGSTSCDVGTELTAFPEERQEDRISVALQIIVLEVKQELGEDTQVWCGYPRDFPNMDQATQAASVFVIPSKEFKIKRQQGLLNGDFDFVQASKDFAMDVEESGYSTYAELSDFASIPMAAMVVRHDVWSNPDKRQVIDRYLEAYARSLSAAKANPEEFAKWQAEFSGRENPGWFGGLQVTGSDGKRDAEATLSRANRLTEEQMKIFPEAGCFSEEALTYLPKMVVAPDAAFIQGPKC